MLDEDDEELELEELEALEVDALVVLPDVDPLVDALVVPLEVDPVGAPPEPVPVLVVAVAPAGMHSGDVGCEVGQQMSAFPPRSVELMQTRPVSQSSLPFLREQRSPSPCWAHDVSDAIAALNDRAAPRPSKRRHVEVEGISVLALHEVGRRTKQGWVGRAMTKQRASVRPFSCRSPRRRDRRS